MAPHGEICANREHKSYPNIRETLFYSPEAGLVRFYKWNINLPSSVMFNVPPLKLHIPNRCFDNQSMLVSEGRKRPRNTVGCI
ncbi:hypothetical protein SH528x_002948 [Novipirellula sp. SH528]|uniref:hypothetical protein n=1 Tax=Novipirellula sp. SH528 TaxID=3454466 RepID=UPI003F9F61FB